jgi:hypothetical protein
MKTAQEKMIQNGYDQMIRSKADVDAFKESDALTLSQSRSIIKNNFENNLKSVIIVPNISAITLSVGQTLQLTAFLYRNTLSGFNFTPDAFGEDVTGTAQWIKDPSISTAITLSRGLITAAVADAVDVYVKVGDFESSKITVTVV